MPFFVVCRSNQHLWLWVPAQGRDDDLCMTRSRVTNLTDSIFKQSAMRGHTFAISPNAFFARYSFISRPPNRGRRECRAPETCRFARRGKSPAPGRRIRAGATRMDRPADCLYSSTRRLIFFLKPSSCVQYATTGNPTKQSTAMSILRPRQICHPDLSLAGVLKVVRGRYGTHLTSQSVQRKPGARADRQPASDTVNPCLLELPVGRHHLSRRRAVE